MTSQQQFTSIAPSRPYIIKKSGPATASFLLAHQYKIQEFQVPQGRQLSEWSLGFSGVNESISAIAVLETSSSVHSNKRIKMKNSQASSPSFQYVLCGTVDGKLLLWHQNTLQAEFQLDSSEKILSIAPVQDSSGRVFILCDSASSPLYELSVFQKGAKAATSALKKVKPSISGSSRSDRFTSIASFTYNNQSYLLIGTSTGIVHVVDVVSMGATAKLLGHSGDVNRICILDGFVITASDSDMFVNVYDLRSLGDSTSEVRPRKTLHTPAEVSALDATFTQDSNSMDVLAVCSTQVVLAWRFETPSSTKGKQAQTSIQTDHTCTISAANKGTIFGAALSRQQSSHYAVLMTGALTRPVFQSVDYLTDTSIQVKDAASRLIEAEDKYLLRDGAPEVDAASVNVVSAATENTSLSAARGMNGVQRDAISLPKPNKENIQNKLNQVGDVRSHSSLHYASFLSQSDVPTFNVAKELRDLVKQQRYNDVRFSEILLIADEEIVHAAVQSLTGDLAFSLFSHLDSLLVSSEANFQRLEVIALWQTAILSCHGAYLQKIPNISKKLLKTMQSLQQRTSLYQPMLSLSGKLDMLLGMAKYKRASTDPEQDREAEEHAASAPTVQIETEEQQDEMMDEEDEDDVDQDDYDDVGLLTAK